MNVLCTRKASLTRSIAADLNGQFLNCRDLAFYERFCDEELIADWGRVKMIVQPRPSNLT